MKTFFGCGRTRALAVVAGVLLVAGYAGASGRKAPELGRSEPENVGTFTLTGIPAEFDGKNVSFSIMSYPPHLFINSARTGDPNVLNIAVTNGELKMPVYTTGRTSTDTFSIMWAISEGDFRQRNAASISFTSVQFENGVAKMNWNDVKVDWAFKAEPAAPASSTETTAIPAQMAQAASPSITTEHWDVHDVATWIEAVGGIRSGGSYKAHIVTINGVISVPITPVEENTFGGSTNITVTLKGNGTLSPSSANGNLLRIGKGQTVVVKDLTLRGRDDNTGSVVITSGDFVMEGGASVTGNKKTSGVGGGVRVDGGTFTMKDKASVSGNSAGNTGGVYVGSGTFTMRDNATVSDNTGTGVYIGGTFTMQDNATVSGNTDTGVYVGFEEGFTLRKGTFIMRDNATVAGNTAGKGGGVHVGAGTFTMRDNSTVSGNSATSSSSFDGGGGVFVDENGLFTMQDSAILSGNTAVRGGGVCIGGVGFSSGDFIMEGGAIQGNKADSGGGVYIGGRYGTFTMKGGTISGNNANSGGRDGGNGGGVYSGNTFIMQNGMISNNTAGRNGGGVYAASNFQDNFNMQGGTISGNTAGVDGGGVYANETFIKTGGTIHGGDEANNVKNTAVQGRAVYRKIGPQWRNATAGPSMNPGTYGFWLND